MLKGRQMDVKWSSLVKVILNTLIKGQDVKLVNMSGQQQLDQDIFTK